MVITGNHQSGTLNRLVAKVHFTVHLTQHALHYICIYFSRSNAVNKQRE